MITFRNTASDECTVRYMIAQHTPDPFRKEPRNVGVIVEKNGIIEARFLGECGRGTWDMSQLRSFESPNAYRLWVDHWRKVIDSAGFDGLLRSGNSSFSVIPGGEVGDTGDDPAGDVCQFLFGRVVFRSRKPEIVSQDELPATGPLPKELRSAFRELGLMSSSSRVRNPILSPHYVRGASTWHEIPFYQETETDCWAMETVDFSVRRKSAARDHAAYAHVAFTDLMRPEFVSDRTVHAIGIVRLSEEDSENRDVGQGLEILGRSCTILRWNDPKEREEFLKARVRTATAA